MNKLMTIAAFFFLTITTTFAAELHNYYPSETQNEIKNGNDESIKNYLFEVLQSTHQKNGNKPDTLGCSRDSGKCYRQLSLGYKGARKVLFGKLHLDKDSRGYFIKDVYCRKEIRKTHTRMGPGTIPNSNIINCEHTWPQSKFSRQFEKGLQKSDLHHLFPTDNHANSVRGNYPFANVNGSTVREDCSASRTEGHGGKFEPPTEHKGNVARALFYFAVRYKMAISHSQEQVLRDWHIQDPVDAEELERNENIYLIQKNRNPFIDMPELVDNIKNF